MSDLIDRQAALEKIHWLGLDNDTATKCDLAIRALPSATPSRPTEPSEDTISRQAVDEAIYDYSRSCDVNYAQIMEYIDKIPSVNPQEPSNISNDGTLTVNVEDGRKITRVLVCGANHWGGLYYPDEQEPKTGHWIIDKGSLDAFYGEVCKCSECGGESIGTSYFCPDCGAKMESEEQA